MRKSPGKMSLQGHRGMRASGVSVSGYRRVTRSGFRLLGVCNLNPNPKSLTLTMFTPNILNLGSAKPNPTPTNPRSRLGLWELGLRALGFRV